MPDDEYELKRRGFANLLEAAYLHQTGFPLDDKTRGLIDSFAAEPSGFIVNILSRGLPGHQEGSSGIARYASMSAHDILDEFRLACELKPDLAPVFDSMLAFYHSCTMQVIGFAQKGNTFSRIDYETGEQVLEELHQGGKLEQWATELYDGRNKHNPFENDSLASVSSEAADFVQTMWGLAVAALFDHSLDQFPLTARTKQILNIEGEDAISLLKVAGQIVSMIENPGSKEMDDFVTYYLFRQFNKEYLRNSGRVKPLNSDSNAPSGKRERIPHDGLSEIENNHPGKQDQSYADIEADVDAEKALAQLIEMEKPRVVEAMSLFLIHGAGEISKDEFEDGLNGLGYTHDAARKAAQRAFVRLSAEDREALISKYFSDI